MAGKHGWEATVQTYGHREDHVKSVGLEGPTLASTFESRGRRETDVEEIKAGHNVHLWPIPLTCIRYRECGMRPN